MRGVAGRLAALICVILCTFTTTGTWRAQGDGGTGGGLTEELRIRIVNTVGGEIAVSRDRGRTWLRVGAVSRPALQVNRSGFTASKWAQDSAVAATAVNAIHIKVANDPQTGRAVTFSVVPAGKVRGAATRKAGSVIGTDIAAGEWIFGGGLGPYVNSPVRIVRQGRLEALQADYSPRDGDVIVILRRGDSNRLRYIEFENKFGGLIKTVDCEGRTKVIGQVLCPVWGVGRFAGDIDADCGRIRANHPGVIDISTSPVGYVGGFQIIPRGHASSPELWYVREKTQWMVVGPVDARQPSWEGVMPLFGGAIVPSFRVDDITGRHADWLRRVLSRCQVQARIKGGEWGLLPRIAFDPAAPAGMKRPPLGKVWWIRASLQPGAPLPAIADVALKDVTHIRIALPWTTFWPVAGGRESCVTCQPCR